ncbi:hypothetical protein [Bradyrhizobium sp. ERR14]|uniref:hypothetical protein n=1 Tax=Bradyrhizobium sp. ERR14 TaxID=2663837 RepID=UPI00161E0EAE|nr:hypothetical protein [Bradyrhizobium sp. ERR14]MBB4391764.1 hypothetical protein [Bradyrhizobium sp. ERR14]
MAERWLGIVVSGDKAITVDAEVDGGNPLTLQSDQTWSLQPGDKSQAYATLSQQIAGYVRENGIKKVVMKESAVSGGAATMALLQSAELRGAIMAAVAAIVPVECKSKASISKTFGERNVDDYVKDNDFWKQQVTGIELRVGSREAVMIMLAARKDQ